MHDNDLLGGAVLSANLTTVCLLVKDCCYKQCEIRRFQTPDSTENRSSVIVLLVLLLQ